MLVEASGLVKQYPLARALDQVSLEIKEGEVFGLFGPNGAGKTTCLRVLAGLTRPDAGSATVCGVDIRAAPNEVRRQLGILIDIPFPYEDMTVRKYLSFFAAMAGVPRPEIPTKVDWVLSLLGVSRHRESRIGRLSMGERQRAELARVMLSSARMLFLDEPFSNVDVSMRIGLRSILREWVSRGGSILFTSHNLLESEAIVDRYAFLHLGKVIALGTARELKSTLLAPAYELEVSDVDRSLAALRAVPHQSLERAGRGLVRIGLVARDDAPRIARTLVEANVDLLEMKSLGTMEDVYSRLTQPAAQPITGGLR
jgi:ABC-type multidrug transport system ATPase subunit